MKIVYGLKSIEIDYFDTDGYDGEPFQGCVRVDEFNDFDENTGVDKTCSTSSLVNPNEKVINAETINITFDYPLRNPAVIEFKQAGGFTRYQLYKAV